MKKLKRFAGVLAVLIMIISLSGTNTSAGIGWGRPTPRPIENSIQTLSGISNSPLWHVLDQTWSVLISELYQIGHII